MIFFDNVYMYGKVSGEMTESTPYRPCSRKGEIRAKISQMLEREMRMGSIKAIIARAADLYGPFGTKTSLPFILVIDRLMKGKKAMLLISDTKKHYFTYTVDAAKGMILLANSEKSYNRIWHLPTHNHAPTGKEFVELAAKELGTKPSYHILKKWIIKAGGLLDKNMAEAYEMLYQNECDYIFSSNKFNRTFDYNPISYKDGIKETVTHLKRYRQLRD